MASIMFQALLGYFHILDLTFMPTPQTRYFYSHFAQEETKHIEVTGFMKGLEY